MLFPFPDQSGKIPSVLNCDRCNEGDREGVKIELLEDGVYVRDTFLVRVDAVEYFSCWNHRQCGYLQLLTGCRGRGDAGRNDEGNRFDGAQLFNGGVKRRRFRCIGIEDGLGIIEDQDDIVG